LNKAMDRPFFLTAAVVAALVAFAGFARTYYLKGLFGAPEVSSLLHVHGVVMTLWVLLFVTQVGLVRADRTDLHRRLGVAGAILALAVVALGAVTAIDAARRGAPAGPPPLVFLAITLSVLVVFAILVVAGLVLRKRSDYHKRLMTLATLTVIQPAISRLAIDATGIFHPLLFFGITIVMLVAFIAWDWARNRRLHPAFAWGMLFFLVSLPVRFVIAGSGPWQDVARWLTAG
jgi:hypothetical protein